ncbi:GNAT family N-acetyltransferase [Lysinibacillus sp. 54212]|uniref:GNAT family N-acetyltransferase n=1 Tax=Lysinibacillus sp. 54212 TaxID=3119829 RepID=UPI002FC9C0C9
MTKKMEKKYIPLAEFFNNTTQPEITLSYEAIENIMGQELPNAAYLNSSWWKKTKPPLSHYLSWVNAGYNVIDVKLGRSVTFSQLSAKKSDDDTEGMCSKPTYIIRPIESDEARAFINLQELVNKESDLEYYGEKEQNLTVQQVRKNLLEWRKLKNRTILLCIVNGIYAGYAVIKGNRSPRTNHVASLRIGVIASQQCLGIGSALLTHAEQWAMGHHIERIESCILVHNEAAIALFQKHGYSLDGTREGSVKIGNMTFNENYYSKRLV